jgi:A/G-specific adenine glycosylase
VEAIRRAVWAWFDPMRRPLPFRAADDPYAILVAEVMSQQTRAEAVTPYWRRFLTRFPTPEALAEAAPEQVLAAWQGLGYYRRALRLRDAARVLVREHGGRVPSDPTTLSRLPGVGPYVAAAVASLAFARDVPAVDANVARVLVRLLGVAEPIGRSATRRTLRAAAAVLLPPGEAGRWNTALMDLGAEVCRAGSPRCGICPLSPFCAARSAGTARSLPIRAARRSRPTVPVTLLVVRAAGRVAVRRRPEHGLLGGLWEFPTTEGVVDAEAAARCYGLQCGGWEPWSVFCHGFTHRVWEVHPFLGELRAGSDPGEGLTWIDPSDLGRWPLAGPTRRVAVGAGWLPERGRDPGGGG